MNSSYDEELYLEEQHIKKSIEGRYIERRGDMVFEYNSYLSDFMKATKGDKSIDIRPNVIELRRRIPMEDMPSHVRVDYSLEGEFENMQSHGMPKCIDNKPGFSTSELTRNSELSKLKVESIMDTGTFPTSLPMRICTDSKEHMYLYNSPEGIACVKHSFTDGYNEKRSVYETETSKFELMDYREALKYLRGNGVNLEFGSIEARDFVDSRNYTGIRGFLSRMKNKTASIASKAASFLGLDDDKDGR